MQGDLYVVLGCLRYILQKTANMNPTVTPEKHGSQRSGSEEIVDADGDDPFRLNDNSFMHGPSEEGDTYNDTSA